MYTALHFTVALKISTPPGVIRILHVMTNVGGFGTPEDRLMLPDHPLFGDTRWRSMLVCDSYYFEADTHSCVIDYPTIGHGLSITCNFKNYHDELRLFLDWIMPFVDAEPGEWLGYHMYEERERPTLIFYPGGES